MPQRPEKRNEDDLQDRVCENCEKTFTTGPLFLRHIKKCKANEYKKNLKKNRERSIVQPSTVVQPAVVTQSSNDVRELEEVAQGSAVLEEDEVDEREEEIEDAVVRAHCIFLDIVNSY